METFVDLDEISASYQTMGNLYTSDITGLGDESLEQTSSMYVSDVKVTDAYRFLKFYMEEQLISPGDETQVSVVTSVIYYNPNRKQHQKALRKALDDLNEKIMSDPALELVKN